LRVAELAEVHDAADGRVRGGRDLDQVELLLLRQAERVLRRHDAELRPVGADDAHLARPDLHVHAGLVLDLGYVPPPGMRAWAAGQASATRVAYSAAFSLTGSTRTCTGASQSGSLPAVCSSRIAMKRSSEPSTARWSMTGVASVPSAVTQVSTERSGMARSICA